MVRNIDRHLNMVFVRNDCRLRSYALSSQVAGRNDEGWLGRSILELRRVIALRGRVQTRINSIQSLMRLSKMQIYLHLQYQTGNGAEGQHK